MRRRTRVVLSHDDLSDIFFARREARQTITIPRRAKKLIQEYAKKHNLTVSTAIIRLCFYQIIADNAENLRRRKWEKIVWMGNYSASFGRESTEDLRPGETALLGVSGEATDPNKKPDAA